MNVCPKCIRTLASVHIRRNSLQEISGSNRRIGGRQISLWSIFSKSVFSQPESPPSAPSPPPSPASLATANQPQPPSAERKLAKSLKKVEEKRQATIFATQKETEQQLVAWGESDPLSENVTPPFQDPLGHLTFIEQIAYLANPPDEYLRTLEERAKVRERYEKALFHADPITYWKLAYDVKPELSGNALPEWRPWSQEKRLEMMEKYRRYDERFQRKAQEIFEFFASEEYLKRTGRQVMYRIQKEIRQNAITVAKRKSKGGQKDKSPQPIVEEPPLRVIERKVHRMAIRQRNDALNRYWYQHIQEVSVFDDLDEEGLTPSEARKKKMPEVLEQKRAEEEKQRKAIKDWGTLSTDVKIESVDWRAIHSEI